MIRLVVLLSISILSGCSTTPPIPNNSTSLSNGNIFSLVNQNTLFFRHNAKDLYFHENGLLLYEIDNNLHSSSWDIKNNQLCMSNICSSVYMSNNNKSFNLSINGYPLQSFLIYQGDVLDFKHRVKNDDVSISNILPLLKKSNIAAQPSLTQNLGLLIGAAAASNKGYKGKDVLNAYSQTYDKYRRESEKKANAELERRKGVFSVNLNRRNYLVDLKENRLLREERERKAKIEAERKRQLAILEEEKKKLVEMQKKLEKLAEQSREEELKIIRKNLFEEIQSSYKSGTDPLLLLARLKKIHNKHPKIFTENQSGFIESIKFTTKTSKLKNKLSSFERSTSSGSQWLGLFYPKLDKAIKKNFNTDQQKKYLGMIYEGELVFIYSGRLFTIDNPYPLLSSILKDSSSLDTKELTIIRAPIGDYSASYADEGNFHKITKVSSAQRRAGSSQPITSYAIGAAKGAITGAAVSIKSYCKVNNCK